MKSVVGIYESHKEAVLAVQMLKDAGYPVKRVSLIGKAFYNQDHTYLKTNNVIEESEVSIGVVAGSILGVLTGVGIFAIPGLGFLYGAGAFVGAIAGFDIGLLGGGIAAVLTSIGIDEINSHRYAKLLDENKFIVFVQGTEIEIAQAKHLLHTTSDHLGVDSH
jgi:uncharacterized membrane protein